MSGRVTTRAGVRLTNPFGITDLACRTGLFGSAFSGSAFFVEAKFVVTTRIVAATTFFAGLFLTELIGCTICIGFAFFDNRVIATIASG